MCLIYSREEEEAEQKKKKSLKMATEGGVKEVTVGGVKEVKGNENSLEIESLARFAVDEHNKKENSVLEFVKVVNTKVQVVSGTLYYITLEAVDGGKKKVYEAKVWVQPWKNFKEVQEFKLVGNAPSDSSAST